MIKRKINDLIKNNSNKGKVLVVLGPRQVGKTTAMKAFCSSQADTVLWLNGDDFDVRAQLAHATQTQLKALIGSTSIIVIDEAQRIENVGLAIKLLIDSFPEKQILVSGSSALELSSTISEPLTGRKYEYVMYPLSYIEMVDHQGALYERRLLEHRLIYGYYPDIVTHPGEEQELLFNLANSYLYKDILAYQQVKKPAILEKLLMALALQIGSEVSYNELGRLIGLDTNTVERYIDLLEKSFVVFRLQSLSRNMRNEIKNGRKVYFYDNGIRNAIIKNFNAPALRTDIGALWENFCIVERMKSLSHASRQVNRFFWRTHAQQEIDYIEEYQGVLHAFEFKWNPKKAPRFPKSFLDSYPDTTTTVVTRDSLEGFIAN